MSRVPLPLIGLLLATACGEAPPEDWAPSATRPDQRAEAPRAMVAAAHPLAVEAGVEALRRGGNAVDAAVTVGFALSVLEPVMAGLGGGGSMTLWLEEEGRAEHLEFYASSPATPDHALDEASDTAFAAERGVLIPGTVAGFLEAHERFGTLERREILEPAVVLARGGFVVHTFLARLLEEATETLGADPATAGVFYPAGEPLRAGDRLVQLDVTRVLERVAREGRDGFYRGPFAQALVDTLAARGNPMTHEDLAGFQPRWRRPLCAPFGDLVVLAAPPPMGGTEVVEALNLLADRDLATLGLPTESPEALGLLADALRIARADRVAWVGAPDSAAVPGAGLASPAFARERSALVGGPVPEETEAGDPWDEDGSASPDRCAPFDPFPPSVFPRPEAETEDVERAPGRTGHGATSHISVVDAAGNAVSLTFTLPQDYARGVFFRGILMNSASFSYGGPAANQRAPGRPRRSSTAPSLVLEGDDVRLVVGSPGSQRIPPAIVQTILYTLVYDLDPATALAMPRISPSIGSTRLDVEAGISADALAGVRARGYEPSAHRPLDNYFGGVHVVMARADGTKIGAADPRRDGAAAGY